MSVNPHPRRARAAFTLVELLITIVTATLIMGGALAAYIYGLKMLQFTQPKLHASDDARRMVGMLTEDIRSAFEVTVGNRTNNLFVEVPPFTPKLGDALRIYPSTNTNHFVIYFLDRNNKTLKRTTNNATFTTVVATAITNTIVFAAEDFRGNVLTNNMDNHVIDFTLQFYQLQYPKTAVGPGNYYDWYQLRTKATKRTLF